MDYQNYLPHPDLQSIVKCFWTLEVPAQDEVERQLIIPDGFIEMVFILGEDIKRFTSEDEYILQPRNMVIGQITEPFYIEPTGYVNSFAIRFYPYGFANLVTVPLQNLSNKETPLEDLFDQETIKLLGKKIELAADTPERIRIIEQFLFDMLHKKSTIDHIVKSTIDSIFSTKGSTAIQSILQGNESKRRQLERNFKKQIGISPKQLGKVIRLQTALRMLLNQKSESLTDIAYESDYYDQAHFNRDFKEFTGTTPGDFLGDGKMTLSSLIYKKD